MKIKKVLGLSTFIIQLLFFNYLSTQTDWIEAYFVPHIFYPISTFFRKTTSNIPFSVGLVSAYILGIFLTFRLIKAIRQILRKEKGFKSSFLSLFNWLSPIYFFFMITWGLLYYRQPISHLLAYDTTPVSSQELKSLCEDLVQKTNLFRAELADSTIKSTTVKQIFSKAPQEFRNTHLPYLNYHTPSIKMATGSGFIAYMGAGGIYTFWSGEANINKVHAMHDIPEVTLHEMAHQMGFASEDEANYVAWLIGKNSADPLFKYSAHYNVVWRALNRLWNLDSTFANTLYSQIDSTVYRDLELAQSNWKPYRNPVQEYIISPFYNLFLKANGQEQGIMSYDGVIDLMIYERRKLLENSK